MSIIKKTPLYTSVIVALFLTLLMPIADWYYWDSGLSNISPTVVRSSGNIGLLSIVFMVGLVFWLPFFIYDTIGRSTIGSLRAKFATIWFYLIYATGVFLDGYAIFMAARPRADDGFAILATIFYTIPLLIVGNVVLLIFSTIWRRHKTVC